jgi:hypothetical protein
MALMVFADKLKAGSSVVFVDATTNRTHTITPRRKRRR